MASRYNRGRRIIDDSSSDSNSDSNSDDDFPDLKDVVKAPKLASARNTGLPVSQSEQPAAKSVRRRKLGAIADNPLLRPLGGTTWSSSTPIEKNKAGARKKSITPQRIELRTRKTKSIVTSFEVDDSSEAGSIHEETIIEDFSGSDFGASLSADEEEDDDSTFGEAPQRSPSKPKGLGNVGKGKKTQRDRERSPSPSAQLLAEAMEAEERDDTQASESSRRSTEAKAFKENAELSRCSPTSDPAEPLSRLRM